MEPTAFAEALVDTGGAFLDQLRELATLHETFDPSTSTRIFVLHAVDYVMATVLPRIMKRRFYSNIRNRESVREFADRNSSLIRRIGFVPSPPPEIHRFGLPIHHR
jgi:DNA-binding transcriptional LysR family regulator